MVKLRGKTKTFKSGGGQGRSRGRGRGSFPPALQKLISRKKMTDTGRGQGPIDSDIYVPSVRVSEGNSSAHPEEHNK